jgi:hypothetical protein
MHSLLTVVLSLVSVETAVHPQINPVSKSLRRSVEELHKWEDHKRLHVGTGSVNSIG